MAAGLGFKTFTTGEVLTAGDVNGYLMQGINVFASTAARNAAITSPQEGQFAFTKDTNSLWYYDGAAWVASGATGDIEGVTAGIGISGGGTSGTVTVTNSMATAIDAKGDLIPGTGADTFSRLAVGANGTVLTADSAEATGLKWASTATGGMTSIASGSLSGSSLALTSISGSYKSLQLVLRSLSTTASSTPSLTMNGVTTDYTWVGMQYNSRTATSTLVGGDTQASIDFTLQNNFLASGTTNHCVLDFPDYASTNNFQICNFTSHFQNSFSGTNQIAVQGTGRCSTNSAVSSITITLDTGTFDNGTYVLYGVS